MEAFEIREPAEDSPVIVEVPHAGLGLDAQTLNWLVAPARCVARDADLYVDQLFAEAPAAGATLIAAHISRYAVDLNRSIDDYDGQTVVGGPAGDRPRGVVWRLTSEGLSVLAERLPPEELERRLASYWRPYHEALERLVERKRRRFGAAVLLCAHSMPTPRNRGLRALVPAQLADVVPGTRGRTSAAAGLIDCVDETARAHGLTVEHDVPYRGGFTTGHWGRPAERVHAVQIELARRLYMDEQELTVDAQGFERIKGFSLDVVERLVNAARAM
jgi:N-formylglutamate deformylase